jgi:hypothetical protein
MLSDVCAQFVTDTESRKTSTKRIAECAAELADSVARWYHDGWYGIEPYAVLKAARDVIAAPHDAKAVTKLKRIAEAVRAYHDCPPYDDGSSPEYIKYKDDLWDAVIAIAKDVLGNNFEATMRAAETKCKKYEKKQLEYQNRYRR